MIVRAADLGDVDQIGEVHVAAWRVGYRGQMPDEYLDGLAAADRSLFWQEFLESGSEQAGRLVVVEVGERVAGFACFGPANGVDDRGELYAMNVHPDQWRRGCGSALLQVASDQIQAMGYSDAVLWVGRQNVGARRFYSAHGWQPDGAERVEEVFGTSVDMVRYATHLLRRVLA